MWKRLLFKKMRVVKEDPLKELTSGVSFALKNTKMRSITRNISMNIRNHQNPNIITVMYVRTNFPPMMKHGQLTPTILLIKDLKQFLE